MVKSWLTGLGFASLLAAAWLVQGCEGMNCTEMGCGENVAITFEPALEQGEGYVFVVHPDEGETVTCSVPMVGNHVCILSSGGSLRLEIMGQAEGDGIEGLRLWGAPRSFELVIRKDGEQISRTSHRPKYSTYYPNGEACDADWGGCQQASVQVDL